MFARVDHIGVAVEDLDAAIALHERVYGMAVAHREVVDAQGVEAVLLDVGDLVGDVQATLDTLRDRGLRLIDEAPRTGIRGSRVAFLHPESSGGVLTEIVQPSEGH